jgi:hypothetical protein
MKFQETQVDGISSKFMTFHEIELKNISSKKICQMFMKVHEKIHQFME